MSASRPGRGSEGSNHPEIARTNPIFILSSYSSGGFRRRRGVRGVDLSKTNPILPHGQTRWRSFQEHAVRVLLARRGWFGRGMPGWHADRSRDAGRVRRVRCGSMRSDEEGGPVRRSGPMPFHPTRPGHRIRDRERRPHPREAGLGPSTMRLVLRPVARPGNDPRNRRGPAPVRPEEKAPDDPRRWFVLDPGGYRRLHRPGALD